MFTHILIPTPPRQDCGANLAPYLGNITFPKNREAILQAVEENTENDIEDNERIIAIFRTLPAAVYNSAEDVHRALARQMKTSCTGKDI